MSASFEQEKRIFSLKEFLASLTRLAANFSGILKTVRAKRLNPQMIEKIMLSITAVNRCRYCTYVHTIQALKAGVSSAEVQKLMEFDLGQCSEEEAEACAFAQHYAENNGQPDRNALRRLVQCFGVPKARDILLYISMIEFGNLFGNTVDAFLPSFLKKSTS